MTARTKQKALATLDGMAEIARAEMLIPNSYVTEVRVPARKGNICGGRKSCAVGSCFIAYGVKPLRDPLFGDTLPGVEDHERDEFMKRRPALRAAYDALNEAALRYKATHPRVRMHTAWEAPIEALFEGSGKARADMLSIIAEARKIVEAT